MGQYDNTKVLVTGGAGFLGSHLCRGLVDDEYDVICLDNFFTGNRRNIKDLLGRPNFELVRHDIVFPYFVEVDEIYNLACPASPIHYQHNAIKTIKANVIGTTNMLGLAKRVGAKFFQASTSEVYGDPKVHPQTEDYRGNVNTMGPRACYDEGKRCAETLCADYHRTHAVPIKIARIFNTYGPAMHPEDGRVVSNFVVQALRNQPITIFGDGQQTRSFCFASDLVRGFRLFMDSRKELVGPMNLGNPGEFTMLELAELVIELTGSRSEVEYFPLPEDDPLQRRPDISLAKSELNWTPEIDLRTGLVKTIEYFEKMLRDLG